MSTPWWRQRTAAPNVMAIHHISVWTNLSHVMVALFKKQYLLPLHISSSRYRVLFKRKKQGDFIAHAHKSVVHYEKYCMSLDLKNNPCLSLDFFFSLAQETEKMHCLQMQKIFINNTHRRRKVLVLSLSS